MVKYLVRHWVNADFIAEKIVDESEVNTKNNDLGKNKTPDGTFSYVMVQGSEKLNRTTYEIYDEKLNDGSKNPASNE